MTASFAPPCSGPLREAIAAVVAEWMSASVEATTRAVNVDAFIVWSACSTRHMSRVRASSSFGSMPFSM